MKYISFKTGICLAIVGLMFILFYYYTPWLFDDYCFAETYLRFNGGSTSFSLPTLYQFAEVTREGDNARLANILSPVSTLMMPHWLFAVVAGSLCAVLIYLIVKCASIGKAQMPLAISGTALASIVCLPWRDNIFVADFFLNYVLSSVFILIVLLLIWQVAYRNILSPLSLVASGVLAVVAAWMHEGFSIPVCVGLGLYALVRKFKLPWQWYVLVLLFGLGSLWVISAPGIWIRIGRGMHRIEDVGLAKRLIQFTPLLLPLLVAVVAIYLNHRGRRKLRVLVLRSPLMVYAGAILTSTAITYVVWPLSRAAWPAEMFMMIMVLMLGKELLQRIPVKTSTWLLALALIVFVTVMEYALSWQKKLYEENERIVAAIEVGNGTVYKDLVVDSLTRSHVLYLPTYNAYLHQFQYIALNDWFKKTCAVVPAEMAEFDVAELVPVDSTVSRWRSHLIAPYNSETCAGDTIIDGNLYLRVNFTDPQGVLRSYLRKI